MNKVFAFIDDQWVPVRSVNIFHHGLGYIPVNSVKVHNGTGWVTVSFENGYSTLIQEKELVGV